MAVMIQNLNLVKLLLNYGADVNLKVALDFISGIQRCGRKDSLALRS
jgi:hypothetical protein